ncbi:hypothetical protein O0I52_11830, partial [Staphylococcus pseudintermedius]|nr:hypothetical protein [Staphylococcus pseudintermedius]MDF0099363.1 hypothetical protein [Staphylococcus pseudintermedius]
EYLLNKEQRKVVKPYVWRYKLVTPLAKIKIGLIPINELVFDGLSSLLENLNDLVRNIEYRIFKFLSTDPLFVRNTRKKFENKLIELEDDTGLERLARFTEEKKENNLVYVRPTESNKNS